MSDENIGESLLGRLFGLQMHIDQIATEFKDPATSPERKALLEIELRQWYAVLTEIYQERNSD